MQANFALAVEASPLEKRLIAEGMAVDRLTAIPGSLEDARQTVAMAQEMRANWVVLDGYQFAASYQEVVKEAGLFLLFADDYGHAGHYYADLVLNQNIYAYDGLYASREPYTRLLLGTDYVLLRREFLKWRGWRREIPEVAHHVLVTLGGGDPDNITLKVIHALQQVDVPGLEAKVAVGLANPHLETLRRAAQLSTVSLQLLTDVNNMAELMVWADLAVSAGGSTCWELSFMGVPNIMLVLAENQSTAATELDKTGAALNLGWHEEITPARIALATTQLLVLPGARAEMARRGQDLVDGYGVDRVLMRLRGQKIRLRRAREEDARLVWGWANDPSVRMVSFSSELIPWGQHLKWFKSKLNDPDCVFYIIVNEEETPVGQVRYDVSGHEAVISVSLDANFRGRGYGSAAIELASRQLFRVSGATLIHAYVRMANEASSKAFLKAGFRKLGIAMVHGQRAYHFILPKEEVA